MDLAKRQICIVDDEKDLADACAEVLAHDYLPRVFYSAEEAIRALEGITDPIWF